MDTAGDAIDLVPEADRDIEELAAETNASARAGRNAGTGNTHLRATDAVRRFDRWLELLGTDSATVSSLGARDRWGDVHIPAEVVDAYVATQVARSGQTSVKSAQRELSALRLAFGRRNWTVPGFTTIEQGTLRSVDHVVARLPRRNRKPAHPIMLGGDLEKIAAAFDALPRDELLIQAVRTYHALAFWFGGRITEAIAKMRWSWIRLSPRQVRVTWPAGLKWQTTDVPLTAGAWEADPNVCPVTRDCRAAR